MRTSEWASVAIAVIVLAGVSVSVANGGGASKVINSGGIAFSNIILAASRGSIWGNAAS